MIPSFDVLDKEVYFDNAATTMIAPEVVHAMQPYLEERFGNPETVYRLGREAKAGVETARQQVASAIGCSTEEIVFTSGGTESNNWALKGCETDNGVVISKVEHPSVTNAARWACKDKPYYEVPVDEFGSVDLGLLEEALGNNGFRFVSIQFANNEIGTIQPVKAIAELCKKYNVPFHCDAVQALGKVPIDVDECGFDMASFSAHKIHGPMGIGAMYIRKGTVIEPLLHGGGHEQGLRSGTLAVHQIVGFGKAADMAVETMGKEMPRLMAITDLLARDLVLKFKAKRNGHPTKRLPNIVNVTIPGMETSLICGLLCTKYGVCTSAGSACSTHKRASNTLEAIGCSLTDILSTLRVSLSRYSTTKDAQMFVNYLQAASRQAEENDLI